MSVLRSQSSECLEAEGLWWLDWPMDMEPSVEEPLLPPLEPDVLEWRGEFDLPEKVSSAVCLEQPVEGTVEKSVEPLRLDKFKQLLGDLAFELDLNEDLVGRASHYLPHLRRRMGDRQSTCGAIVFLTCLKAGSPRTILEVASAAGVRPRHLRSRIRLVQKHMGEPKWSISPELLLPRLCAKLDLPFSVEKKARLVLRRFKKAHPNSHCDSAVLAASALLATCPNLSRSDVQVATGVSRPSLTNVALALVKSL